MTLTEQKQLIMASGENNMYVDALLSDNVLRTSVHTSDTMKISHGNLHVDGHLTA